NPVPRMKPAAIARALLGTDLLVSGGGGLIQDSTGINSVLYYLGVCALARMLGRPVMFYCQGFGPVRTGLGRRLTRLVANRVQLITVRDEESELDMRALGVCRPPIRVTADPVLGLEPADPERVRRILAEEGLLGDVSRMERPAGGSDVGPLTAVAVRPWTGLDLESLAEALRRFVERDRARLLLVPFQPESDRPVCRDLAERVGRSARVLGSAYSPRELMGILACTDLVLGMRLHALIMAAARGIPCLGLAYDPKVERFCQRCGAVSLPLSEAAPDRLHRALQHLLQARAHARRVMQERVEPMVRAVRECAESALSLARQHRSF
ncbi:MAG: polysaccharide pyruvyl transferase CsaB, partial [Candidatus Eremiobacterota bacterium]